MGHQGPTRQAVVALKLEEGGASGGAWWDSGCSAESRGEPSETPRAWAWCDSVGGGGV